MISSFDLESRADKSLDVAGATGAGVEAAATAGVVAATGGAVVAVGAGVVSADAAVAAVA